MNRSKSYCTPPEQKGGCLLQLVPRHQVISSECTDLQFFRVQQPIQLLVMDPDLSCSSEVPTRASIYNSDNTNFGVLHLVSGYIGTVNFTT
ncbi:hypothetical protein AYI70_g5801 [Smittium culicis]|uniref:Uncharacterized protein n=1 Tax=Smittium culicis TaxID=133412 RepID=A0A1R1XSS1_9FUNG|nr:hypothetical protein AYI70_g5801 [Smittium culicis]